MDNITYIPSFVDDADNVLSVLLAELDLEHRAESPRKEVYMNDYLEPYTYGAPGNQRTFNPKPWHPAVLAIRTRLEAQFNCAFEVCFINVYEHQHHHLGWHADDSPEMDDARPIITVSLGAEREIWFRVNGEKDVRNFHKIKLENGSVCAMPPGFQDTHQHRIPKHDRECGVRMSLTFRGYVAGVES